MKIIPYKVLLVKPIIICIMFLYCGCRDTTAINQEKMNMTPTNEETCEQVIIKFLKWYKINLNKANNFPILIKDSTDNFMINKEASTNYLKFLETSECISQKYIDHWTVYFHEQATELKNHPIQSDVPEGFDYDFILITQEPDLVLNQIDQIVFTTISANDSVALIGLKWPEKNGIEYEFEMYKSKNGWQIGYISFPNFD